MIRRREFIAGLGSAHHPGTLLATADEVFQ
jgi:hypothetical protein